jgi:hypothetical protein
MQTTGVKGLTITVIVSSEPGAKLPSSITLTYVEFQVIGQAVVVVIDRETPQTETRPTITISTPSEAEVCTICFVSPLVHCATAVLY